MALLSRVFLVTGANKGIGKSIVKKLLQDQTEKIVYLTSRNEELGQKAINDLEKNGLKPRYHQLDITDQSSINRLRDYLAQNYNGLDVLVNNAAIGSYDVEVSQDCNFFGTMDVCEALFPILKHDARVVHLSSNYSTFGYNLLSPELKRRFSDPNLNVEGLNFLFYS